MKENFFYVIDSGSKSNQLMLSDVSKLDNVMQMSSPFKFKNKFLAKLNRIHFSVKINSRIPLIGKSIWNRSSIINKNCDLNKQNWLVLTNWSICKFATSYIKKLQKRDNFKIVMLYLDSFNKVPKYYKKLISKISFDLVYSFDKADCDKYKWLYINSIYSCVNIVNDSNPKYDFYFIGAEKTRGDFIFNLFNSLTSKGYKCNFVMITNNFKKERDIEGFHQLKDRITYDKILADIQNSKGIVDIVQKGQDGLTMRPYEAIFYNKFLLSNNPNVKKMDFYNSNFMFEFDNVDDLNKMNLNLNEKVDYHYDNRYSPIKLIERIPSDHIKNKENKE